MHITTNYDLWSIFTRSTDKVQINILFVHLRIRICVMKGAPSGNILMLVGSRTITANAIMVWTVLMNACIEIKFEGNHPSLHDDSGLK